MEELPTTCTEKELKELGKNKNRQGVVPRVRRFRDGKNWYDCEMELNLLEDGTFTWMDEWNAGRDDSGSSTFEGIWFVNQFGVVECHGFLTKGSSGWNATGPSERGDEVVHEINILYFKGIENDCLLSVDDKQGEEESCGWCAPYEKEQRPVLS